MGAGRRADDVEALNEESDEIDGDLEVATEEQQNCQDVVGFLCVSRKMFWCLLAKKKKLFIESRREIDTEQVKRSDIDIWKDSIALAEKNAERTERNGKKWKNQ